MKLPLSKDELEKQQLAQKRFRLNQESAARARLIETIQFYQIDLNKPKIKINGNKSGS